MSRMRSKELAPYRLTRLGGMAFCQRCADEGRESTRRMTRDKHCSLCRGVLMPVVTPQKEVPQPIPFVQDRGVDSITYAIRRLLAEN